MSNQEIISIIDKGIDKLIHRFLEKPYSFYSENDLHCELYHILSEMGLNKSCRVRADKRIVESSILHKEYPTKGRYRRNNSGPSEKVERGSRGHLDISIWDPDITEDRYFRRSGGRGEQRTLAAIEMSLNEHHERFQWHVYWDLLKLNDPMNEIERGIILFFVRDYPYKQVTFPKDGFLRKLHEMFGSEAKTHIIYIEYCLDENTIWLITKTKFLTYKHYHNKE